jgi:molecular chaperone GrpE
MTMPDAEQRTSGPQSGSEDAGTVQFAERAKAAEPESTSEGERGLLDTIDALKSEQGKNEERIRELEDLLLRGRAELENLRKRFQKESQEALKYAIDPFVKDLLPSIDNLERALEAAKGTDNSEALLQGVTLTLGELKRALAKHGVQEVNSVGLAFDPRVHEAIESQETEDVPSGHVAKEYQKGYALHGRLIRPARVSVSANRAAKEP